MFVFSLFVFVISAHSFLHIIEVIMSTRLKANSIFRDKTLSTFCCILESEEDC